jgi:hypothetical protein
MSISNCDAQEIIGRLKNQEARTGLNGFIELREAVRIIEEQCEYVTLPDSQAAESTAK